MYGRRDAPVAQILLGVEAMPYCNGVKIPEHVPEILSMNAFATYNLCNDAMGVSWSLDVRD